MSKNDSAPDRVTHSTEFVLAHQPIIDNTVIEKNGETYTGYGWDREEADKNAGEKYNRGKTD